jgi:hypothetical protein
MEAAGETADIESGRADPRPAGARTLMHSDFITLFVTVTNLGVFLAVAIGWWLHRRSN